MLRDRPEASLLLSSAPLPPQWPVLGKAAFKQQQLPSLINLSTFRLCSCTSASFLPPAPMATSIAGYCSQCPMLCCICCFLLWLLLFAAVAVLFCCSSLVPRQFVNQRLDGHAVGLASGALHALPVAGRRAVEPARKRPSNMQTQQTSRVHVLMLI